MNRRSLLSGIIGATGLTALGGASFSPPKFKKAYASSLRVMTVGDSITASGFWQTEFSRLCSTHAGVTLDIRNVGVGGSRTTYWPDRINGLMTQHNPDLVTFFTGTNDDMNETLYGEPATSWAWRATVESIRNFKNPPISIVPCFIQYSDPIAKYASYDPTGAEPITNDRIYAQWGKYNPAGWFAGLADFQVIPATATYLDNGGIHPTDRGYKYMGRITYDAIQAKMGWPVCSEPKLCDLYGHRKGYDRPTYTTCP